jgi:hypothetical protein
MFPPDDGIYYVDISEANRLIRNLQGRNAYLEMALKQVGERCEERRRGRCDLECLGRAVCDVSELAPFLPEEVVYGRA